MSIVEIKGEKGHLQFLIVSLLFNIVVLNAAGQTLKEIESWRVHLPNGWNITTVGKIIPLGDLPLNMAATSSGKLIAVTNNGVGVQTVQLIDASRDILLDSVVMRKAWVGLAFSSDQKYLYASGGNDNFIIRFQVQKGRLIPSDTIIFGKPWPARISIAGIAVDDRRQLLYAVTKEDNSLYLADTRTLQVIKKLGIGAEGYTCILSPDYRTLFISCWGCDKIILFDTQKQEFSGSIPVGDNPNDMCISSDGRFLYVANANDNSVSVIDVKKGIVVEVLNSALYPDSPGGSTTNSVALSEDNRILYIANADNNCLAVFDVSSPGKSRSKGFIPTGWYPTCVRVVNNKIFVTSGKGLSSMANPDGPVPFISDVEYQRRGATRPKKEQYIGSLFRGVMNIINVPDEDQLEIYSQVVFNNTPYDKATEFTTESAEGNPIPGRVGDISPIKYVFYIIKENRTYDQVLGDMPEGNGDSSLVLFGSNITPNQHALANEFVLLDNFYVDGEVSADGHSWSMGAYATDFLEKNWPTSYGGRGGSYDGEGTREIANNKSGYLWDDCKKYGVSFRTYGEFMSGSEPNIPVLHDHFCPYFTSWDQSVRDTVRFNQWRREFDSLLAKGKVPHFNSLRFINDHTEGMSRGKPTVFAHVADNDLATGLFVDYLSHSKIWKESVVFIVEDDAQNGPDHVDAHRSIAFVAGGYVKKGFVDHTMYSTSSLLRTMELILGLPPMTQYDAAATSMWRCFSTTPDHPPFSVKPCQVDLNSKNNVDNRFARLSESFDFSMEDRIPDDEFNKVIWVAVKGEQAELPAPRRAAFFRQDDND